MSLILTILTIFPIILTVQEGLSTVSTPPTLQDLFQELLNQPEYEGQQIALAIESYVSGNYDTFAHRTNVDITNRFTVFNILNIGNNLRELDL